MCLSNEVTKSFITVSLIRETQFDNRGRQVIYFTQGSFLSVCSVADFNIHNLDKCIPDSASCIARHTGLDVAGFTYRKPYADWTFQQWTAEICRHNVVVISPWLFQNWLTSAPENSVREFFFEVSHLKDC